MEKRSSTFYDGSNFKAEKEIMETRTIESFGEDDRHLLKNISNEDILDKL